jgi:hypothetical protein
MLVPVASNLHSPEISRDFRKRQRDWSARCVPCPRRHQTENLRQENVRPEIEPVLSIHGLEREQTESAERGISPAKADEQKKSATRSKVDPASRVRYKMQKRYDKAAGDIDQKSRKRLPRVKGRQPFSHLESQHAPNPTTKRHQYMVSHRTPAGPDLTIQPVR